MQLLWNKNENISCNDNILVISLLEVEKYQILE